MNANTNRRSFIRQLSLGLSAAIFTPHVIAATWKDTLKYGRINPAWINAPYEVAFWGLGNFDEQFIEGVQLIPFSRRYEMVNNKFVEILP